MEKFIQDFAMSAGITVDYAFQQLLGQVGRMAEPEEVASLVHFLVSPAAAYLTGTNHAINSGSLPVV